MTNSTIQGATQMDSSSKAQITQAITLQTYCNSVISQGPINLTNDPNLQQYSTEINTGLTTAQGHANDYMNNIQPLIISNVTSIYNYYSMIKAVPTALPQGSTEAAWIQTLTAVKAQSDQYYQNINTVVSKLQTLNTNLGTDSGNFQTIVGNLNSAVNGDNGVLESIKSQLDTIQSNIDGAIAGIALSGLAIAGGVFITAVGAIADFVTAGTSTPLVVGGIAIIAAGVGGEVASAITLKNLNDSKSNLLREEASLTDEVKVAVAASSAYSSLYTQSQAAVLAATQMGNAWQFLSGDVSSLINDLQQGITTTDALRTIFLTASNTAIQSILTDTNIIKAQMTGVTDTVAPAGETVGDFIVSQANQYQKAA